MRSHSLAATVFLLFAAAPASAQEGKRYALLVGVNEYEHAKLAPLKWAENDVAALATVLKRSGYEVSLLTGAARGAKDRPTKANIDGRLKSILDAAGKRDTILIALAGHGLQFEGGKDAYFCPSDAKPFKDESGTLVSLGKVYDELDKSFAGVKVLLVDACRDDPAAGRGSRGVDADAAPAPPKGVAALFSCSAGQRAFEHDDLKHGVFFHHVLQGLSGKAKDSEGEVTFNGLSDYVSRKVRTDVPKLIGGGAKQLPNQKGEFVGGSPVVVKIGAPADAVEFRGKKYKVFSDELTWKEARDQCEAMGGKLVTVPDAEVNEFLVGIADKEGLIEFWIGATDEAEEGKWVWVDGTPVKWTKWGLNQPNNKDKQEHYALITTRDGARNIKSIKKGDWWDQPNKASASVPHHPGFICEWSK